MFLKYTWKIIFLVLVRHCTVGLWDLEWLMIPQLTQISR